MVAIIDMGTNTFHLLIAKGREEGYQIVHRERYAVKIGMEGINKGIITESGIQRALVAMQNFKSSIDKLNIKQIYAFGTSAFRNAQNGKDVAHAITELTGIEINIISGDQEAEFIYMGVKSALDMGADKSLIIDIGGGSVEFIIGNHFNIFWKQSFEIGAQRLLECFQKNDPILITEIQALNSHFEHTLVPLLGALQTHNPTLLIGSSGTFDTLSDIFCAAHNLPISADDRETPLTISGFYKIYKDLITKNRTERLSILGMIEMRVDMSVVACCLIRFILEKHFFNNIRVSTYSLKEGVLASIAKQVSCQDSF